MQVYRDLLVLSALLLLYCVRVCVCVPADALQIALDCQLSLSVFANAKCTEAPPENRLGRRQSHFMYPLYVSMEYVCVQRTHSGSFSLGTRWRRRKIFMIPKWNLRKCQPKITEIPSGFSRISESFPKISQRMQRENENARRTTGAIAGTYEREVPA